VGIPDNQITLWLGGEGSDKIQTILRLNGVQGVAGANPATPTMRRY
jgi:hypothetical protein